MLFLLLLAFPARAQTALDDLVYTVGTTTVDTHGRDWAYILWQGTSRSLISGQTFAVYAKQGDASSASPYVRQAVVNLQTDARVIEPILRRAESVGEDTARLQADMESIFVTVLPTNTISRAERLSAVIRGSIGDEQHYNNLLLLSRLHPGVSMSLGLAHAQPISPGQTTFEIRAYDVAAAKDMAVVGRVTVTAGSPTVLPAPGPVVLVPDATPKGDLNAKLRWGTPDPLRRLSLLQHGFNVHRVTREYAEAASNNWHVVPPSAATLLARERANPNDVRQLNRLPILNPVDFTLAEAANLAGPGAETNTVFFADDDGRFKPGYTTVNFTNGARFYYFVSARDVLGRDGLVSPGTLLTICDRMPPPPPRQVTVANDYTFSITGAVQKLRVTWTQATNTTQESVSNYFVYRWSSPAEMNLLAGNPSNNLIGVVPHTNGLAMTSFLDTGAGSPSIVTDAGKTFWYSVRAADAGACGPNLSGNSAPAFGVLRDRVGPAAPSGFVLTNGSQPNACISVVFSPTLKSREWRIYKRVDDGPLTLNAQGTIANVANSITNCDDVFPANAATLCYFVQLLDENGNASALTRVGCITVGPAAPLSVPVLAPIVSAGNGSNPAMQLSWFCAPYGIDRFEVDIAGRFGVASNLSTSLSLTNTNTISLLFTNDALNTNFDFSIFYTPHVGPQFGGTGALFAVTANVQLGNTYTVFVKPIGKDGSVGKRSNVEQFTWSPTNIAGPLVPWPARGLPPTNGFSTNILARYLGQPFAPFDGNGVRIGSFTTGVAAQGGARPQTVVGSGDPARYVFTDAFSAPLLPIAMYRYQVTNANFPIVSGDVIQVSPLMENIAYAENPPGSLVFYDPFVILGVENGPSGKYGIYLVDTQPIISGARYKYLLVRFKPNHEIDQIIPTNEVDVP